MFNPWNLSTVHTIALYVFYHLREFSSHNSHVEKYNSNIFINDESIGMYTLSVCSAIEKLYLSPLLKGTVFPPEKK